MVPCAGVTISATEACVVPCAGVTISATEAVWSHVLVLPLVLQRPCGPMCWCYH